MRTEITTQIECWSCENGHNWTIDQDPQFPKISPYDEGYTASQMSGWGYPSAFNIEGVGIVEIKPGDCPQCFTAGVFPVPKLAIGTDPQNNMSTMSVIDPASVADLTKEIVTGKDPETGDQIKEEVPLDQSEQEAIKIKIQSDIDRMTAMEYNPNQTDMAVPLPDPAITPEAQPNA
jgi:hypothetical protein